MYELGVKPGARVTVLDVLAAGCEIYGVAWEYPQGEFLARIKWFANEVMSSFTWHA